MAPAATTHRRPSARTATSSRARTSTPSSASCWQPRCAGSTTRSARRRGGASSTWEPATARSPARCRGARRPSPRLRRRRTERRRPGGARDPRGDRGRHRRSPRRAPDPPVVLAHELLDNLPFRRFRGTPHGPREVRVGLDGDVTGRGACRDPGPGVVGHRLGSGDEVVVPDEALAFIDRVAAGLHEGYALVIDYGSRGPSGGPAHGYRDHASSPTSWPIRARTTSRPASTSGRSPAAPRTAG